jgi:hypothetical protein
VDVQEQKMGRIQYYPNALAGQQQLPENVPSAAMR